MDQERLPTGFLVDAHLRRMDALAIPAFVVHKGNHVSGLILLKINGLKDKVKLLIQERNFESGELEWVHALEHETVDEFSADQYIQRAIARDPDLWVIEVEDPEMANPFSEK